MEFMSEFVFFEVFHQSFFKTVFKVFSFFILITFLVRFVKICFSRHRLVNYANKLPQLKLCFYHIFGHLHIILPQRLWKTPVSPHVYDLFAINGYNLLFPNEDITNIWQLHIPFVSAYKANSVEMILSHSTELKKAWFYEFLFSWLGTGLLTSQDEKWRRRRKMLTPAFHFNILKDFLPVFNKQSKIFVDVLKNHIQDEYLDIVPFVTKCSLDIICESILGTSMNSQTQPGTPYVKSVMALTFGIFERVVSPWLWPNFLFNISPNGWRYNKNLRLVHDFTNKLIRERKKEKLERLNQNNSTDKGKDVNEFLRKKRAFLDLLLEEHLEHGTISEAEISEEVNTFAFEGHDTTAMAMSWSLYLIGLHPWIQDKIHQELDSIFGDDDRDVTMEDLKDMKYLECVIKEALRLYPSVPGFARKLREDIEFNGHILPKGSTILIFSYMLHRDPEVFPNPEKFDPDRFKPENSAGRHPFAYVPFSAGPRNCIGQRFALMEEKTVLSTLLRRYKIRSLDPRDIVHAIAEVVLRPENSLRIQIRERNQKFDFHGVYYRP